MATCVFVHGRGGGRSIEMVDVVGNRRRHFAEHAEFAFRWKPRRTLLQIDQSVNGTAFCLVLSGVVRTLGQCFRCVAGVVGEYFDSGNDRLLTRVGHTVGSQLCVDHSLLVAGRNLGRIRGQWPDTSKHSRVMIMALNCTAGARIDGSGEH